MKKINDNENEEQNLYKWCSGIEVMEWSNVYSLSVGKVGYGTALSELRL
jgi:hypothetical protein